MVVKPVVVERAAVVIGLLVVAIGVLTPVLVRQDSGVRLAVSDGQVIVWTVDPHSPAAQAGIESGMLVIDVNGRQLIRGPQYVYPPTEPTPDPATGEYPPYVPIGVEPSVPTPVNLTDSERQAIVEARVDDVTAIRRSDLSTWTADQGPDAKQVMNQSPFRLRESLLSVLIGIAVLFTIAWGLARGRPGSSLRGLAVPLAVGVAAPFVLRPLEALWAPAALAGLGVLVAGAMLPLAAALIARIDDPQDRRIALAAAATCALGSVVVGTARALSVPGGEEFSVATWVLAAGITAIPGLIAAGPILPGTRATASDTPAIASGRLLRSTELAVAGLTPGVAMATSTWPYTLPFLLWIVAIALAGRFTVRPLARLASRAQLQRDLVVAATEAERARVAADIHDDALQELTLLVRRLDLAGDTEGADLARGVSDRLRAICGDLRLPILDDLGVGPALDWLVLRIERLAGGEVRLERADGKRPPADVELAIFRVAQEALSNAVKHGQAPIVVRYRSTDGAASLSIDDAGAGIAPGAGDRAEREGHYGLLNMQQRAEAIGAILDIRRWPTGGTHVQLEWRAR